MQVNETLNDGLKRGYAITLTAAELDEREAPSAPPFFALFNLG